MYTKEYSETLGWYHVVPIMSAWLSCLRSIVSIRMVPIRMVTFMCNDKTTLTELLIDMESKGYNALKVNQFPNEGVLVRMRRE